MEDHRIKAPTRLSLLRRIAWLGGDRSLVGVSGAIYLVIGIFMFRGLGLMYGLSLIVPAGLWGLTIMLARRLYKADTWMLPVLGRHNKYRKYYAPKPGLGVAHPRVRDFR